MNSNQRIRARFFFVLMIVGALILGSSLYWTQIINGESYANRADSQYVRPRGSLFDRGSIFFVTKDDTHISAATLGSGYLLYINPTAISNKEQVYEAISHYITIDQSEFLRKAALAPDSYEEITHHIDEVKAKSIAALTIKGVGIVKENWRSYPGNSMAAQSLGLIGENDDGHVQGRYGLELSYEDVLSRSNVGSGVNVFASLFSSLRNSVFGSVDKSKGDILTTIEPTVQGYLEKILGSTSAEWHPDEIGGIIINPKNGEIAAMASLPTFNPNDFSQVKNVAVFSNPLVEHVYEMGSIMKPLTMATGLDNGAITTHSTYDDTGTMTLSGKKISNFDGRARGVIGMQEILSQSLNVGAATIALKVGKDDFAKYFESFGFGEKTGIDEPNEATGIIGNLKTGRDIEIATAAYGQGIAVSPIAMTRALGVLANGGYIIHPHIVKEIDYVDGTDKVIDFPKNESVLKKETVDAVTRMLVEVVDKALAHGGIKMENYSIAAKTGTAQIPDHASGGYYSDRYLHSFFGYFPAYDPKFLVFLYQIHPKGAQYASETLTNPFSDLTKFLINYYNIAPDR